MAPDILCQKAPSAKRCIKTLVHKLETTLPTACVRKHRAPKGALRLRRTDHGYQDHCPVRKHRAPKGALRLCIAVCDLAVGTIESESTERQKVH